MKAKQTTLCFALLVFLLINLSIEILARKHRKRIHKKNKLKLEPELAEVIPICKKYKPKANRIINGPVAHKLNFPWMVAIFMKMNGEMVNQCAGSIITKNHILTAAHCFYYDYPNLILNTHDDIFVRLGDFNIISPHDDKERGVMNLKVTHMASHSQYYQPEQYDNDIALIMLNQSLDFKNPFIQPICVSGLNANLQSLRAGTRLAVTGWGRMYAPPGQFSGVLRFAPMYVINIDYCVWAISNFQKETRNVCLGNLYFSDPARACEGDSGGPFIPFPESGVIAVVVGIVSFGQKNCTPPMMMTNVASYKHWINNFVGIKPK